MTTLWKLNFAHSTWKNLYYEKVNVYYNFLEETCKLAFKEMKKCQFLTFNPKYPDQTLTLFI